MSSVASAQEFVGTDGFDGSLTKLVPDVGSPRKVWRERVFPFSFFFLPFFVAPEAREGATIST